MSKDSLYARAGLTHTHQEPNTELYRPALETLRTLIRTSTSSMTSVPKPLKFLQPHYPGLQALYETWSEDKGTLRYRLLFASLCPASSSPISEPGSWGYEYVRHLAAELGEEYGVRFLGLKEEVVKPGETEAKEEAKKAEPVEVEPVGTIDDFRALAMECATFLLHHNAEPDAVDLLEELEIADRIKDLVDDNTFGLVCQYMLRCVNLLPPPDDLAFLRTVHVIYAHHHKFPQALSLSIRLGGPALIRQDFNAPASLLMKRQLALLLAHAQVPKEWLEPPSSEHGMEDASSSSRRTC
ncbi:26S proteasome regulatory subunit RPN1 [Grifola frondosa]|uniref:26S proteasome regulatory subunit RPN1 n=1 Tax=Grifola frondosa TaxID=5627 RepID=A0A1C7LVA2_GRIFR|nr:26S proteasome regulatory subunit RPN1 [Grifola frondosa]